jgi:5S rRNA maturation endonuclease (ribonuclease M5)
MNEIQAALLALLPAKRKSTPSGWTSFDAVCCHHNGEKYDTRKRGGVMTNPEGGFQYHCFNCGFKAGWSPGKLLSINTKKLFGWMGLSDSDIGKLNLVALKYKEDQPVVKKTVNFELTEKQLPEGTMPVMDWINTAYLPDIAEDIGRIVEYIIGRGMELEWYNWMWSPAAGYVDRVIVPFYHDGKIVGYTGRKITSGKPKYLTDAQPSYVFNLDRQRNNRDYVIVVEGQFDAIAVDGVAIMSNEPNEAQCSRISALGKTVIVVPDRDRPGAKLIGTAIKNGWSVSLPAWENDIKDVADAVQRYGRLYTLSTILHYCVDNEIKIQLLKKKLEALDE